MIKPLEPALRPLALEVAERLFIKRQTVDEVAASMRLSQHIVGWLGCELAFSVLRPSAEALHAFEVVPDPPA